jgi:hypothetical protein
MKASELRIGNIIMFDNLIEAGKEMVVTPRFFSSLASGQTFEDQKRSGECELNGYHKPIPLTEEWLLKFGFALDEKMNIMERGEVTYYYYGDIRSSSFMRVCYHPKGKFTASYYGNPLTKPQYVHELQNLWFALTGKELTITETSSHSQS